MVHKILNISVLFLLIFNPEHRRNRCNSSNKAVKPSFVPIKHVVSSANSLIFNSISPIQIPGIFMFLLIFIAMISAAITKRNGEIGHPCLTPIETTKNSDTYPLLTTQLMAPLYKHLTIFLYWTPIPNHSRALSIKQQNKLFYQKLSRSLMQPKILLSFY